MTKLSTIVTYCVEVQNKTFLLFVAQLQLAKDQADKL